MPEPRTTYAIVGAGLAGAKTAEALREHGFDGRVVLVGSERHVPYERPPLSKGYLQGSAGLGEVLVHPESWYAEHQVDLRRATTVTALDRAAHEVVLGSGERLGYDKLLLATGAMPRRLAVPGVDAVPVHYLRTLDDSDRLKAALVPDARVVVIGGGWIGLETAAAARSAGAQVTVLETAPLPLLRVLGPEVAAMFLALHREHGVDVRCGVTIAGLQAGCATDQAPVTVRLGDGTGVPADTVIVGVGVMPEVHLAAEAGLEIDDGIVVDAGLRTSDPDVFAAGDVANAYSPLLGRHVRVEHWANALHQPDVAARSMLGQPASYERLPYFFTDQFDLGMEYVGHVGRDGYEEVVCRGDLAGRELIAFWLRDRRVLAGMNVNVWDVVPDIEALVRSGRPVDPVRLADPGVPLPDALLPG